MASFKNSLSFLIGLFFLVNVSAQGTPDPVLKVGAKSFKTSELLRRPDIENITLKNVYAYPGTEMHFKAIKAAKLFEGSNIGEEDVIQFRCLDGFASVISKERMLAVHEGQSIAYVAIEDPAAKWPDLPFKNHKGTAGPFYLVWVKPELSKIGEEEWPFKVVAFEIKGKLRELYPKIFPAKSNLRVSRGFKAFQKTCFACHKLNGEGASFIGPDLNLPMNPTEYFQRPALLKYIRDPKSVRSWDNSRMPAFGPEALSDQDIEDIVEYLKVMAEERAAAKK